MNRRVLLIAFHYPPFGASSGVQRTLSYSVYLRQFGWQPYVLTAHRAAYEFTADDQLQDIPATLQVWRTMALDAARHLAWKGRYPSCLAIPDRWRSWWLTGVPAGLSLVRREGIDVIWSTYPIATAHSIAATLARLTRRPWVADFRDPMVEYDSGSKQYFPGNPSLRSARLGIEAHAVRAAARLVFCTEGARRIVVDRYPAMDRGKTCVISNGYDEPSFCDAERRLGQRRHPARSVLLHSGTVYLGPDRDPSWLFAALRMLADQGIVSAANFELRFRHPTNEAAIRELAILHGVDSMLTIAQPVPYREALMEMLAADALLLLQGQTSNPAIPAKLYEYLRARRPIIACTDPGGETAGVLRSLGIHSIAPLTDRDAIATLLAGFIRDRAAARESLPTVEAVASFSREALAGKLAAVLSSAAR